MTRITQRSKALMEQARAVIPGGVNSPVRSYKSVGGVPPFIARAKGSRLHDEDGNEYIDYVGSWGPMILGHAHPQVLDAIERVMRNGTSFGAPTALEVEMAEEVRHRMPCAQRVRMVNSGTEAAMSALRLARGATGRDKILKFDGCYHGHADSLLVNAGSGAATLGVPSSPGVPAALASLTLTVDYNDIEGFNRMMEAHGKEIAAVIIEPVAGNMGCVLPSPGFLEAVQAGCKKHGSVFIVDEVMTGFRVARGGATEKYKLQPDLVVLGKIIGGGLPVGAYGGKADLMDQIAPAGPIYQAGTLSGNPVAMAAGLAQLRLLTDAAYATLEKKTAQLCAALRSAAKSAGAPMQVAQAGSMLGIFLMERMPASFKEAAASDGARFNRFFHALLEQGIYWAPSRFEAAFVSLAHTDEDIERTASAFKTALEA